MVRISDAAAVTSEIASVPCSLRTCTTTIHFRTSSSPILLCYTCRSLCPTHTADPGDLGGVLLRRVRAALRARVRACDAMVL